MDYLTNDTDLTAVADAIREKGGTNAALEWPSGYVDAIDAIETGGGSTETATISISPNTWGALDYVWWVDATNSFRSDYELSEDYLYLTIEPLVGSMVVIGTATSPLSTTISGCTLSHSQTIGNRPPYYLYFYIVTG